MIRQDDYLQEAKRPFSPYLQVIPAPTHWAHSSTSQLYLLQGNACDANRFVFANDVSWHQSANPSLKRLKILHINDLHGHVARVSSTGNQPLFSRIVSRVQALRHRYEHDAKTAVLFLSAGDDMIGSVFDLLLESEPNNRFHAAYHVYARAGLDAVGLGNHDLDIGPDVLANFIYHDTSFPVLAANLQTDHRLAQLVFPAAVLGIKGVRVGLIGVTTMAQLKRTGIRVTNPLPPVINLAELLRPFCDAIILLSHLGHRLDSETAVVQSMGDVELARQLPENSIDLIIGAHSHDLLNNGGLTPTNVVNSIPIVQAGRNGRYLGEVTLSLGARAKVTHAALKLVSDLPVDWEFEETAHLVDADRFYMHDGEFLFPFAYQDVPTIVSLRDNVYPETLMNFFRRCSRKSGNGALSAILFSTTGFRKT